MTIDWNVLIPSLIGLLSGGGIVGIFTLRQTARGKKIDNDAKLVEEYRKLAEEMKTLAISERKERKAIEEKTDQERAELIEKIATLTGRVNELERQTSKLKDQLDHANYMYRKANMLMCTVIECPLRDPKLTEKVKEELKAMMGLGDMTYVRKTEDPTETLD